MFLVRTAFWLSLVVIFLPTGTESGEEAVETLSVPGREASEADALSAGEALAAARDAMADLSGFCGRNPDTCETGSAALKVFGQKAQYGARMVYEYLAELDEGGDGDDATAGAGSASHATNDTLSPNDREIPWAGPQDVRG